MAETHKRLIELWREAASATLQAQKLLDRRFEAFLAGKSPPPDEAELSELRKLQDLEASRLKAALRYAERKARGLPTEPGVLE